MTTIELIRRFFTSIPDCEHRSELLTSASALLDALGPVQGDIADAGRKLGHTAIDFAVFGTTETADVLRDAGRAYHLLTVLQRADERIANL